MIAERHTRRIHCLVLHDLIDAVPWRDGIVG
jgi:hypothetical protein